MKQLIKKLLQEQTDEKKKKLLRFFFQTVFKRKFTLTYDMYEKNGDDIGDFIDEKEFKVSPLMIRLTPENRLVMYFPENRYNYDNIVCLESGERETELIEKLKGLASHYGLEFTKYYINHIEIEYLDSEWEYEKTWIDSEWEYEKTWIDNNYTGFVISHDGKELGNL